MWRKANTYGSVPSPARKHSASIVGKNIFFIGGSHIKEGAVVYNEVLIFDTGIFLNFFVFMFSFD